MLATLDGLKLTSLQIEVATTLAAQNFVPIQPTRCLLYRVENDLLHRVMFLRHSESSCYVMSSSQSLSLRTVEFYGGRSVH